MTDDKSMNFDRLLEGKKCLVTSGAHGMGYSIAKLFALHGGMVAVCGRDPSGSKTGEELNEISAGSFFFRCDMSDPLQVDAFGKEVQERYGFVDVLVNNVGTDQREKIEDLEISSLDYVFQVNFKASLLLLKRFFPLMKENKAEGSIIFISSMNALSPAPTLASYASSKGAVNSLSRVLANEGGKYRIRSNVICPGWIATTYIEKDARQALHRGESLFDMFEYYDGTSPLMAPGRPSDVANAALFFASAMSSYITGAQILVDGGAVMQAHKTSFPQPEDAQKLRRDYYRTVLREWGLEDD